MYRGIRVSKLPPFAPRIMITIPCVLKEFLGFHDGFDIAKIISRNNFAPRGALFTVAMHTRIFSVAF